MANKIVFHGSNGSRVIAGATNERADGPVDSDSDDERRAARREQYRKFDQDRMISAVPEEEQGTLCWCVNAICTVFGNAICSIGSCVKNICECIFCCFNYQEPSWAERYPLHHACDQGNFEQIRQLIAQGRDINQEDDRGDTPIHFLLVHHHYELIPDLIQLKADINRPDGTGKTILHKLLALDIDIAIDTVKKTWRPFIQQELSANEINLLDVLIAADADLNAGDREGRPPVLRAMRTGALNRLLVGGAEINVADKEGITPLHVACDKGSAKRIAMLCVLGADVTAQDKDGRTPLLTFAVRKHFSSMESVDDDPERIKKVLRSLEQCEGFDLRAKDIRGYTVMHCAGLAQNKALIRYLMDHKNMSITGRDASNGTVLHHACAEGHFEFIKFLVDECHANVNLQDVTGRTPLFLACENPTGKVKRQTRQEIAQFLLASGAKPDLGIPHPTKEGKFIGPDLKAINEEIEKKKKQAVIPNHVGVLASQALPNEKAREDAKTFVPDEDGKKA